MNNCKKFKNLIEKFIEGTISDSQLKELEEHSRTCQSCREEFEGCTLMQESVKHAFLSTITCEQAKASVMKELAAKPDRQALRTHYNPAWLAGKRTAIVASILLAAGLLIGFILGRTNTSESTDLQLATVVPIHVTDLEGTVLVRHQDSDTWQTLTPDSSVRIGDTFHSAAKSAFTLKMDAESKIEVEQSSMLALTSYNGQTQFFLEHGRCKASLESPHRPFFISTPHGRVEALGTEFTVTVD
jgi:ferric-dicitrate binding protein FerR (iron transport regulator)